MLPSFDELLLILELLNNKIFSFYWVQNIFIKDQSIDA